MNEEEKLCNSAMHKPNRKRFIEEANSEEAIFIWGQHMFGWEIKYLAFSEERIVAAAS